MRPGGDGQNAVSRLRLPCVGLTPSACEDGYRIVTKEVYKWQFDEFKRDLEQLAGKPATDVFSDKAVTEEELDHLLDGNQDGKVSGLDIPSLAGGRNPAETFESLSNLLDKYSYRLKDKIAQSLSAKDPDFILSDRNIVRAAVGFDGSVLRFLGQPFRDDEYIAAPALQNNLSARQYISQDMRDSGSFVREVFRQFGIMRIDGPLIFSKIYGPQQEREWEAAKAKLHKAGVPIPAIMRQSYAVFKNSLASKYPDLTRQIYSVWTAAVVLSNQESIAIQTDQRPVALLIYPTADLGAFESYPLVDQLVLSNRFRVFYYQASVEGDIKNIAKDFAQKGIRVSRLVLAGHGTSQSIALSGTALGAAGDAPPPAKEAQYIDVSDVAAGDFQKLLSLLTPDAQVFLYSCSNGEGGATNPQNLANSFASVLPRGIEVISAQQPDNITNMDLKGGRLLLDASMGNYIVYGKK